MKFKKIYFFDYIDVNFNAPPSLFKQYTIFGNSVLIEQVKLTFFSEDKFYDRK